MKKDDKAGRMVTHIVMESLKRNGIPVVEVSDEQAKLFYGDKIRRVNAEFSLVDDRLLYSNARRALESIRQERATPGQWLAMLTKAGGIKAGEDRWTGLSEWLQSRTEPVLDKSEIARYIDGNGIILHEEQFDELKKTPQYIELERELLRFYDSIEDNYREADEKYEEFMQSMQDAYGDDWEYEMSEDESQLEQQLLDIRDHWDSAQYTFDEMAEEYMSEKYGDIFSAAFLIEYGRLKINSRPDVDMFLKDWTIHDTRLLHTTGKLENYHELAVWAEGVKPWHEDDTIHFGEVGQGRCIGWVRFGDTVSQRVYTPQELQRQMQAMPTPEQWERVEGTGIYKDADLYFPPGFDPAQPTDYILKRKNESSYVFQPLRGSGFICLSLKEAVQMYNERHVPRCENTRVLVIDEIQSDRHQTGRKKGYRMTEKEMQEHGRQMADISRERQGLEKALAEKYKSETFSLYATPDELQRITDCSNRLTEMFRQGLSRGDGAEPAPFEKNWHELLMKRMFRYAAENGYDKLAWTKGEQQIERYNVKKYIDIIEVHTEPQKDNEYKSINVLYKDGGNSRMFMNRDGRIQGAEGVMEQANGKMLDDVFGKNLADEIRNTHSGGIVGGNLNITGERMKAFYDTILTSFVSSYGKKWGMKVHDLPLPHLTERRSEDDYKIVMHAVDVTLEMKRSVMQGQPMFMRAGGGQVYGWAMNGTIFLTPKGMNAETAIHEYTHLWAEVMRQQDPEGWAHIKDLLRDTPVWNEVVKDKNYHYLRKDEDKLASEVLARTSGRENTAKLEQSVKQAMKRNDNLKGFQQIHQALNKFWSWVGRHVFHIKQAQTISDVTDRILGDLLRGGMPGQKKSDNRITDIQLRIFGEKPCQIPRMRCCIDGQQQMFVDVPSKEFKQLQREPDLHKREVMMEQLATRLFAEQLQQQPESALKR